MSHIVIKNVAIYQDHKIIENQNIAIKDDLIEGFPTIIDSDAYDEIIDGSSKLATPGFVNAHNHIAMTVFRSYADDMNLMDWLQKKIWPAEEKLDSDIVYYQTLLGIAEMLRGGTTSFADMYFFMDDVARAVAETGIRASLCRGLTGIAPNGQQALQESKTFFSNWNGKADGRISIMLGPHAPYTSPPDY